VHHDLATLIVKRGVEDRVLSQSDRDCANQERVEWETRALAFSIGPQARGVLGESARVKLVKAGNVRNGARRERHGLGHSLLHAAQLDTRPRRGRSRCGGGRVRARAVALYVFS